MITAFMATVPWRQDVVGTAILSLIDQVDCLELYAGDCAVPPLLADMSKIRVTYGPNIGDRGRWQPGRTTDGYVFCVDDDILYPPDYVVRLRNLLDKYERQLLVGVHGRSFRKQQPESYFHDSDCHCFYDALADETPVHVLGTGTLAYHTDCLRLIPEQFAMANVADLLVALKCTRQAIPRLLTPRPAGWLEQLPITRSIYEERAQQAETHRWLSQLVHWAQPPLTPKKWRDHGREQAAPEPGVL